MKKILPLLLSFAMLISFAFPANAVESTIAESDNQYTIAIIQTENTSYSQSRSATSTTSLTASELASLSPADLQNYDLITIESAHISLLSIWGHRAEQKFIHPPSL